MTDIWTDRHGRVLTPTGRSAESAFGTIRTEFEVWDGAESRTLELTYADRIDLELRPLTVEWSDWCRANWGRKAVA